MATVKGRVEDQPWDSFCAVVESRVGRNMLFYKTHRVNSMFVSCDVLEGCQEEISPRYLGDKNLELRREICAGNNRVCLSKHT